MERRAIFPGSFDPITKGHESVVIRSLDLFDKIIIAIGINDNKNQFFPIDLRMEWIKQVFSEYPSVSVVKYEGLTVDLCKKHKANYILRGLRTSADFEFERSIGPVNHSLDPGIETVFLLTCAEHTAISSSIVREVYRHGGDISQFIPDKLDINIVEKARIRNKHR